MKLKNYLFNGFGFPVLFEEVPATRLRGELVPDLDFLKVTPDLIRYICTLQEFPLSGNQVKFFRHALNLSLREFAKVVGVTHQSVMRWEDQKNLPAKMEAHTEIVIRLLMLNKFNASKEQVLEVATNHVNAVAKLKAKTYKKFQPLLFSDTKATLTR